MIKIKWEKSLLPTSPIYPFKWDKEPPKMSCFVETSGTHFVWYALGIIMCQNFVIALPHQSPLPLLHTFTFWHVKNIHCNSWTSVIWSYHSVIWNSFWSIPIAGYVSEDLLFPKTNIRLVRCQSGTSRCHGMLNGQSPAWSPWQPSWQSQSFSSGGETGSKQGVYCFGGDRWSIKFLTNLPIPVSNTSGLWLQCYLATNINR